RGGVGPRPPCQRSRRGRGGRRRRRSRGGGARVFRAAGRGQGPASRADRRSDRRGRLRRTLGAGGRRALLGVRRFSLPRALPRREGSDRSGGVAQMVRAVAAVGGSREKTAMTVKVEGG